jgi:hypothetical protein
LLHFLAFFASGALYLTSTADFFSPALLSRFLGFGVSSLVFLDTIDSTLVVSFLTEAFVGVLLRILAILSDFLRVRGVLMVRYFKTLVKTSTFLTFTVVFFFKWVLVLLIASKFSSSVNFFAYLLFFLETST